MPENEHIRNKLQSIKTLLELLENGKEPSQKLVNIAIKDFEALKEILLK